MCERCADLVVELQEMDPKMTEADACNVLWSFTAFPFSSYEHSAEQARDHVRKVVAARSSGGEQT